MHGQTNTHRFEYGECHYYPFVLSINRCDTSCSTIDGTFGRIYVSNKIEDINLKVFNLIKGIIETLKTYHLSADKNLMVGNVTRDKNRPIISVIVSVKKQ